MEQKKFICICTAIFVCLMLAAGILFLTIDNRTQYNALYGEYVLINPLNNENINDFYLSVSDDIFYYRQYGEDYSEVYHIKDYRGDLKKFVFDESSYLNNEFCNICFSIRKAGDREVALIYFTDFIHDGEGETPFRIFVKKGHIGYIDDNFNIELFVKNE